MKKITLLSLSAFFAAFLLSACHSPAPEYDATHEVISLDSTMAESDDARVVALLDSLKKIYGEKMDIVIGSCDHTIDKARPQGELSNVLTDMLFEVGDSLSKKIYGEGIDFSILNFGGIRKPLVEGDVTVGDIFSILPFDNIIVLTTIKGSELRKVIGQMNDTLNQPFSHVCMKMEGHQSPSQIMVNGKPLDDAKTYRFVTVDFLVINFGDNIFVERGTEKKFELGPLHLTDITLRDVAIRYVQKVQNVKGYLDDRVTR